MDKDLTKESLPFIIGVIWREVQRMKHFESFGDCLKRCLKENHLSASEAAKLVGFRSRNSIFRNKILKRRSRSIPIFLT